MQLTEHELTAASSVVAIIAIAGGYLGVRAANRNAARIASDERSAKQQAELEALKREVYSKYYGGLMAIIFTKTDFAVAGAHRDEQMKELGDKIVTLAALAAQVELLAGKPLREVASKMLGKVLNADSIDELKNINDDDDRLLDALPV